ncbi:MAG: hypothetical protein UF228_10735 [Lachnospiraceae bacterium]|nr:hypothetical protein [Lachnospiraceae bacterium]
MNALQNEIDKLNTLKESFSELSKKVLDTQAVLTELNHGKQEMVDALAMKNVQSSTDKTLVEIASDVRSIAQSSITIEGGEMYEKQLFGAPTDKTNAYEQPDSPTWNLYQVMANLLSDGRFVKYGGIVLCEYSKGVRSQYFEGASLGGLYFTSEGKVVEAVEEYIWDDFGDGKANRWVAIINKEENIDVTFNTVQNTPLSIHIGRKVGLLTLNATGGMVSEIVCTNGNEYTLLSKQTSAFGKNNILRGLGPISHRSIISPEALKSLSRLVLSINGDITTPITDNKGFLYVGGAGPAKTIIIEKVGKISTLISGLNDQKTALEYVEFPMGYRLTGTLSHRFAEGLASSPIMTIAGIKELAGRIIYNEVTSTNLYLQELIMPDLEVIESGGTIIQTYRNTQGGIYSALKRIVLPKLREQRGSIATFPLTNYPAACKELIDVEVGAMETSFSFTDWEPSSVLADADKIVQLNKNIRDHIAAIVTDRNGLEPLTATFSQALRDVLTEETEQAFRDKNWNIAPAKTVTE